MRTLPETDTEAFFLDTKIRIKDHQHDISAGVECESVGRQATKLIGADTGVDHNAVIDAALSLLQLKVKEGELQDKADRCLQRPHTRLTRRIVIWVARRRKDPSGCCERFITIDLATQHCWTRTMSVHQSDSE